LIGLFLGSTVVLLATSDFDPTSTAQTILGTTLPDSSADVVALAVGEGLAGLSSALFLLVGKVRRSRQQHQQQAACCMLRAVHHYN